MGGTSITEVWRKCRDIQEEKGDGGVVCKKKGSCSAIRAPILAVELR